MDRIEYLKDQIIRAERLAKDLFDRLTVERLQAFAAECRSELALLDDGTQLTPIRMKAEDRLATVTGFHAGEVTP